MNVDPDNLLELFQLIAAAVALVIAPGAITAAFVHLRPAILAECVPLRANRSGAATWRIILLNRSKHVEGVSVVIFPATQGNVVQSAKMKTETDGGLILDHAIDSGALRLDFRRFHRRRYVVTHVLFSGPDVPALHCSVGRVRVILPDKLDVEKGRSVYMALIHHRVALIWLTLTANFLIICGRVVYLAFK